MIRLVATDVDGTLVKDGTCDINPDYYNALVTLKRMGIKVVIASGRQEDSILRVFEPIADELIYISNDGACVSEDGDVLFSKAIPAEFLPMLVEDLKRLDGCDFALASRDSYVYMDSASKPFIDYMNSYRFKGILFEGYDSLPPVYHIGVWHDPHSAHPALSLTSKYEDRLGWFVSGKEWVDFTAMGISKGAALEVIQKKYGISREETAAFGDQANDRSMLEKAKYNFAVKGSVADIEGYAEYTAPPMLHDGVLQVIRQIIIDNGECRWQKDA